MILDEEFFPALISPSTNLVNECLVPHLEAPVVLSSPSHFNTREKSPDDDEISLSSKLATMTDSYFPTSHRSSVSSGSDFVLPDFPERPGQPGRTTTTSSASSRASTASQVKINPSDPLSRNYPVPEKELDLDEMLARPPKKWTLGHYLKETPVREVPPPVQTKEKRALELAAAKKELLREWEDLRGLGNGRR